MADEGPKKKKLSKRRKTEQVEIEEEDGTSKSYVLTEVMGDQRDVFQNLIGSKTRYNEAGNPIGMKDSKGIATRLIAMHITDATTGESIKEEEINKWPSSTQLELVQICNRLSGFNLGQAQAEAKND
jgi:hypothetical protein